jgi:hypothetical protein
MINKLSVPIQLFIKAQKEGFKNELRFFLLLKLLYPCGKTKLNLGELAFIELELQIKSRKTIKNHISKLIELEFLVYNSKTQYYIIKGFDKIRTIHHLENRLAFPIGYYNYKNLDSVIGAVLYGYLHKDFWRKVKKKKSVHLKGSTYSFPKFNFNFKKHPAPVSVYGVQQIFDIPIASASRLKKAARKAKYLRVKHTFKNISNSEATTLKYIKNIKELRYYKGKYYLQSIDTVCPLFYFKKRKSLE